MKLEHYELHMADYIGRKREQQNIDEERSTRRRMDDRDGFELHIEGAEGEIAFAKATKLYYPMHLSVGSIPDVPPFHVRCTQYRSGGILIQPDDPVGLYSLVLKLGADLFEIVGWCYSRKFTAHPPNYKSKKGIMEWRIDQTELTPFEKPVPREDRLHIPAYLLDHLCHCGAYGCNGYGWPPKWRCDQHKEDRNGSTGEGSRAHQGGV